MNHVRRAVFGSAVSAAAAAVLLVFTGGSAQAHFTNAYHGKDYAAYSSDHVRVSVCDREADGNRAYVVVLKPDGSTRYFFDSYGGYCSTGYPMTYRGWWKLCEQTKGCTNWQYF